MHIIWQKNTDPWTKYLIKIATLLLRIRKRHEIYWTNNKEEGLGNLKSH